ncbi:MAG: hypothetical protein ABWZ75_01250 [Novosphingobium sp.]
MRIRWDERASAAQIAAMAAQIDTAGYCRIDGFVSSDELESLARIGEAAVQRNGGEYVALTGLEGFAGSVWEMFSASPALRHVCEQLYRHFTGAPAKSSGFHQVFRCLKGKSVKGHSLYFHFDSYVITILVPILIPQTRLSGELILFPARRPIRKSWWRNVLDKLVMELPTSQLFYRLRADARQSPAVSVALAPGSAIVFCGYRSLHTNSRPDPDLLRVTGLLHYGNPHRQL